MRDFASTRAWFLGPKAENQEMFESLLLEAFRDHCYWRKNFHAEDGPFVGAGVASHPDFQAFSHGLRGHLFEVLSELKRSVPFFSPRYLGHMNTDLLIPGVLGYIAAILYNQNNIVQEAGTITIDFEREATALLLAMMGMPKTAWGHLCSGGTSAGIEALWVARNLRLLPYHLALLAEKPGRNALPKPIRQQLKKLEVPRMGSLGRMIEEKALGSLTTPDLIELQDRANDLQLDEHYRGIVDAWSPRELGFARFAMEAKAILKDRFPAAFRIVVSRNAHYSIRKAADVLGLGRGGLLLTDLDTAFRMDLAGARDRVLQTLDGGDEVLALVGVYGSTEEGSIDDFEGLLKFREELRAARRTAFWLHADACYGGYALSMARPKPDIDEVLNLMGGIAKATGVGTGYPHLLWTPAAARRWMTASTALGAVDSIALDPHKMGYIPYPAGAVLYGDRRVRDVVECAAPYLDAAHSNDPTDTESPGLLGHYTLEGSRPGATSAAVLLAHRAVPLDTQGHGRIVAESILGARLLKAVLTGRGDESRGARVVFVPEEPDLNILCYTFSLSVQGYQAPVRLVNEVVSELYASFLPSEHNPTQKRDFVVAKTEFAHEEYGGRLQEILSAAGIEGRIGPKHAQLNPWRDDHEVTVVRTVVMGSFLLSAMTRATRRGPARRLVEEYADILVSEASKVALRLSSEALLRRSPDRMPRLGCRVLVVEDDESYAQALRRQLFKESFKAEPTDIPTAVSADTALALMRGGHPPQAALVDVSLRGDGEGGLQFLRGMAGRTDFKGAVVFTGHSELEDAVKALAGANPAWEIRFRQKPPLDEGLFQFGANAVMSDLWEILNKPVS